MIHPDRTEPVWDILILSVTERREQLNELLDVLTPQLTDQVGFLVLTDDKYYEVGYKRTRLVNMSCAQYVSFIDDDDMIRGDYVETLLPHLNGDNDFVGFEMEYLQNGHQNKEDKPIKLAPKYRAWQEDAEAWWRDIYHIGVIKRDIATRFPFKGMRKEDGNWATDIREAGLVDKWVYVDESLYTYQRSDTGSLTKAFVR